MKRTPLAGVGVIALLLLAGCTGTAMFVSGPNHGQQPLTAKANPNTASQKSPDLPLKQALSRPTKLTKHSAQTYVKQVESTRAYNLVDNRLSGTEKQLSHETVTVSMSNNTTTKQYHISNPAVGHLKKLNEWTGARVLKHTQNGYYVLTSTQITQVSTNPGGQPGSVVRGSTSVSHSESLYYVTPNKTERIALPHVNGNTQYTAVSVVNFDNSTHTANVSATLQSGNTQSVAVSLSSGVARMPFIMSTSRTVLHPYQKSSRIVMHGSNAMVTVSGSGTNQSSTFTASRAKFNPKTWEHVGHLVIITHSGKQVVVPWYQAQ